MKIDIAAIKKYNPMARDVNHITVDDGPKPRPTRRGMVMFDWSPQQRALIYAAINKRYGFNLTAGDVLVYFTVGDFKHIGEDYLKVCGRPLNRNTVDQRYRKATRALNGAKLPELDHFMDQVPWAVSEWKKVLGC